MFRQLAPFDFNKVPLVMRQVAQWIVWQWLLSSDGTKGRKIPLNPANGQAVDVQDTSAWVSFDYAYAAWGNNPNQISGVGFVLAKGFVGIDLDNCINPSTGAIEDRAMEIVRQVNSYTEVSPSGMGVNILATGILPEGGIKKGDIEISDGKRFLAITSVHVFNTSVFVEERTNELHALRSKMLATRSNDFTSETNDAVPERVYENTQTNDVFDDKPRKPSYAELGKRFLENNAVIACSGGLFIYKNGFYQHGAERMVQAYVQSVLGHAARKRDGAETEYWLTTDRMVDEAAINPPGIVNVKNGLLNLETGQLQPHSPDFHSTIQLPSGWDPIAYDERMDRFLNEVLPDLETRHVFEEYLGYSLTTDCRYEKALILVGRGANGKSKLLEAIIAMLGENNVSNLRLQDIDERFRTQCLNGKLVNIHPDLPTSILKDPGTFKALVSGEQITAEKKHIDAFRFRNRAKFIFSANEIPGTSDQSDAFFRRWAIIPFPNQFTKDQEGYDPNLSQKLSTPSASSYLLRLAVEGYRRLVARGHFVDTPTMRQALHDYRKQSDPVLAFFETCCSVVGGDSYVSKDDVYAAYKRFCNEQGFRWISKEKFCQRLIKIAPGISDYKPRLRDGKRLYCWRGIVLVGTDSETPDMQLVCGGD